MIHFKTVPLFGVFSRVEEDFEGFRTNQEHWCQPKMNRGHRQIPGVMES